MMADADNVDKDGMLESASLLEEAPDATGQADVDLQSGVNNVDNASKDDETGLGSPSHAHLSAFVEKEATEEAVIKTADTPQAIHSIHDLKSTFHKDSNLPLNVNIMLALLTFILGAVFILLTALMTDAPTFLRMLFIGLGCAGMMGCGWFLYAISDSNADSE